VKDTKLIASQKYDFVTGLWTELAPMATPHNFSGCVVLPNNGSKVLTVSTAPGADETRSDIYNIGSNTWTQTGSTLYPRAGASLVALGSRVFAVGGNWKPSSSALSATAEEYNAGSGSWSLANSSMISGRKNFAILSLPALLFADLPQGCTGVK
jgi:hypothetical protein